MNALLEHPAIQAGVAPFIAALLASLAFGRARIAWIGIVVGYLIAILLTTGLAFVPLTVSRKVLLLMLLTPVIGLAADRWRLVSARAPVLMAVLAAAVTPWVLASVLAQKEGITQMVLPGVAIAAFAAAVVALTLRLRDDGIATAAAGIGLGAGVGVAALLSASTGYFTSGIALAAASGALMLGQFAAGRVVPACALGGLPIGLGAALFCAAALMLAQLPWYALPATLLVPIVAGLPIAASGSVRLRAALLTLMCLAASAVPIFAAWYATQGAAS